MDDTAELLKALARVKAEFQLRTIETVIRGGVLPLDRGDGGSDGVEQLRTLAPP